MESGDCIAWMDACAINLTPGESCDPQHLTSAEKRRRLFLGKGAYGTVYEGKRTYLDGRKTTRVAVKIIDTASLQLIGTDITNIQRSLQESVRTEVRVLKALCHTNIIKLEAYCLDAGVSPPRMYLVYEFGAGGTLAALLRDDTKAGSFDWPRRVAVAHGVVSALVYMHSGKAGAVVFHRDVKPDNVVLTSDVASGGALIPKLIDCGLAKFIPAYDSKFSRQSSCGRAFGTDGYMCPDYLKAPGNGFDSLSEVYAVGVMLAELFTGKLQNTKDGTGKLHVHDENCLDAKDSDCFKEDSRASPASTDDLENLRDLAVRCLGSKQATAATRRMPAKPARPSLQEVETKLAEIEQRLRPVCRGDLTRDRDWQVRNMPDVVGVALERHDAQRLPQN